MFERKPEPIIRAFGIIKKCTDKIIMEIIRAENCSPWLAVRLGRRPMSPPTGDQPQIASTKPIRGPIVAILLEMPPELGGSPLAL